MGIGSLGKQPIAAFTGDVSSLRENSASRALPT